MKKASWLQKVASLALLALSLLVTGCGKSADGSNNQPVVDVGSFAPYVAQFEQNSVIYSASAVQVTNLKIQFGPMATAEERGVCDITGDQTPVITIDQAYWDSTTEDARKALIFHEMGHCVLRRLHLATLGTDGAPTSLMNPYTIDGSTYDAHQDSYLHELYAEQNDF